MLRSHGASARRASGHRCLYGARTSLLSCLPHLALVWRASGTSGNSIRAKKTGLDVKVLARFDRLGPRLDYAGKILRMNDTGAAPVFQLLICFAEILLFRAVEKLRRARCPCRIHESGNIVDNLPPGQFAGPQGCLCLLSILDVNICSVPSDDAA